MAIKQRVFTHFILPRFQEEEKYRLATITQVIAVATLVGVTVLLVIRLIVGAIQLLVPISAVLMGVAVSLLLLRKGFVQLSGALMLWILIAFCEYLIITNDGLHDSAVLAIPGVLVMAGMVMQRRHFFIYLTASLLSIIIIGYLEIAGIVQNAYSTKTSFLDILDILVIIGITAVAVRLLSDNLIRDFSKAIKNEKRYRYLFEAANDAIFILKDDKIVECNAMSLKIFGCEDYKDIINHTPWDYSPLLQSDGRNSKEKGLEIFFEVLHGMPQKYIWKHLRKNGSLFDAEVSINRLDLGDEKLIQVITRDITEQIEMEMRIKESEEYYRTLAETSPDAIVSINSDGRVSFASRKVKAMFKVPSDYSVHGSMFLDWISPIDREIVKKRFIGAIYKQVQPTMQEFRFMKYDRTEFWGELMSSPIIDSQGKTNGLLAICRDITDRKQAEETLRENEERMRAIVEGTPHLFFYTQDAELNTTYVSPTVEKITGYHVDRWRQQRNWFITDAQCNQTARMKTRSRLRGESTEEPDLVEVLHREGNKILLEIYEYPVFKNGKVIGLQGVAHDITERKYAEEALRENEERFRQLGEAAFEGIAITQQGSFVDGNSQLSQMLGYELSEMVGRPVSDFIAPESRHLVQEQIRTKSENPYEHKMQRKDGSMFPVEAHAKMVTWKGKAMRVTALRDISERKRTEAALLQWANIFKNARWGVAVSDKQGAFIDLLNPAFAKMHGYSIEEIAGKPILDLFTSEERTAIPEHIRIANETGHHVFESLHIRKDGSIFSVQMDLTAVNDVNGKFLYRIAHCQDITERKQAEKALRENEERFRALIENSTDAIISADSAWIISYVSPSHERVTGYRPEQRLGRSLLEVIHPDDVEIALKLLTDIVQVPGLVNLPPIRALHADGSWRWIESVTHNMLAEPAVRAIVINFRDITERRRTENELQESEERFRQLADAAFEGIAITELGRFVDGNFQISKMLGYELSEMIGKSVNDFVAPDSVELVRDKMLANVEKPYEHNAIRKDGSIIPVEAQAKMITWGGKILRVTALRDISERKRAEQTLRESELRFATIFHSSPAAVLLTRMNDSKIVEVNDAWEEVTGYASSEAVNHSGAELNLWVDLDKRNEMLKMVHTEGRSRGEIQIRRKSGEIRDLLLSSDLFELSGDQYMLSIAQDITENKQVEIDLRNSRDELRKLTNRLQTVREEERTSIAREVHDELGQVLTAIKMDLSLMKGEMKDFPQNKQIKQVQSEINGMEKIINSAIQTARSLIRRLRPEVLDASGFIAAILWQTEEFRKHAKISCTAEVPASEIHLKPDVSTALFRIYQEALTNIAKHANAKNVKTIIALQDQKITLTVADDGRGIVPDELKKPNSFGLLGMRERVELLGGICTIEGKLGKGTTLHIEVLI